MKQLLTILIVCLAHAATVKAQSIFVTAGGGYKLPLAGMYIESSSTTTMFKVKPISFAQGVDAHIGVGFSFSEFVKAELIYSHLTMPGVTSKSNYSDNGMSSTTETVYKANNNLISPRIMFAKTNGKFEGTMSFGPVIGLANVRYTEKFNSSYDYMGVSYSSSSEQETEFSGGLVKGFAGSVGLNYFLTEHISTGINYELLATAYTPDKMTLTKYEEDGVDQLPNMSVSEKEIEFVKEAPANNDQPESEPEKYPRTNLPFSNHGVSLNVVIRF